MNAVFLSRLQFGLTAAFHFLFPPLSIGLATIIAVIELLYWRTGKSTYDQMARFWFKLFAIIFTIGVATGITMEFQFGTNWSEYSKYVGDIFGAPLAAEGVFAFFMESTFFGLLLFGRDKISRTMRFISSVFVALGSTLSAFWIIAANSWQQTPAGYKLQDGKAILTNFYDAIFNPSTLPRFFHTVDGAYITGAFFVIGICAYFILRNRNLDIAKPSLKIALIFAFLAVLTQGFLGHEHAKEVALTQPTKLAAFEGMWPSKINAPLNLFGIPDPAKEKTYFEIGIPGYLSKVVYGNKYMEIKGLTAYPKDHRPPVLPTYWSYRGMIYLAGWFVLLVIWGMYLLLKGKIYDNRAFLKASLYSMLLPLLVNELGWFAAEIGRQPWVVYPMFTTNDAVSPLPAYQILISIILFVLIYSGLLATLIYLIRREIKKVVKENVSVTSISGYPINQ